MDTGQRFIKIEATSAKLLFGMAILALVLSNSPWAPAYYQFFHTPVSLLVGQFNINFNLLFFVNDFLMVFFFLVVGLEVKYELLLGNLNSRAKAVLPGLAAIGGMLFPAGIYTWFNFHNSLALRGWAIPTATDIAFSLAILAFLNHRISPSLKTFLAALAIFDDLGAISIIAIFYTENISSLFLELAVGAAFCLIILNVMNVCRLWPYILLGLLLWLFLLKSGMHTTIAGMVLAALVPVTNKKHPEKIPLRKLKNRLQPFVALLILPLFAVANSGLDLVGLTTHVDWFIFFGVMLGLLIGKQIGVFIACWLAVKLGLAQLPNEVVWSEIYGVAILCGVGFTISLFINTLAFDQLANATDYLNAAKLGVLAGSLLSGVVGFLVLSFNSTRSNKSARRHPTI